jgi:hypothetical protein
MVFLLFGCAMEDIPLSEASIYSNLTYDYDTLTFTETLPLDILYQSGDPLDDFIILYKVYYGTSMTSEEVIAYESLFEKLNYVTAYSSITYGQLTSYSTEQLSVVLEGYSIELTLNDVIIFNDLKTTLHEIRGSDEIDISIGKIAYIEQRLSVSLSENDIFHLDLLQSYYAEIRQSNDSFLLRDYSFEDFITHYESSGRVISEDTKNKLFSAYTIINSL